MRTFCDVCERVASTTKKLEKERIVAEYLVLLNETDLATACIFLSGSPFARRDQRITNAGFAAVRDALLDSFPEISVRMSEALIRTGDLGEAVQDLLRDRHVKPSLTLQDVRSLFNGLSEARSNQEKRALMVTYLDRATPLECKYILKILLGGMRIGLQESLVESSLAKAFGASTQRVQYANMLLGDIGECAVLAKGKRLGEARMRLLHPLKPMLASPEEDPVQILEYMDGEGFAEDKYDGIRAQVHKDGEEIRIYSRDLDDITASFPDVVERIVRLPGAYLFDGEIAPYRDGRILPFAELQRRIGRKTPDAAMLSQVPVHYFAFDLLYCDGELLLPVPLRDRRGKLEALCVQYPDAVIPARQFRVQTPEEIDAAFADSRQRNNEGLVIKHPESVYSPGKRGKSWLKLKRALITLDVVVVAAEYGHGKRRGLLSDYTFAVQHKGRFLEIGKAYSGITDAELLQLSDLFHRISIRNEGFYHVVPPQVVLEVAFDRIQRSNRHAGGFALRFPRIKRIRFDKKPDEVDTLETVEALYRRHFEDNESKGQGN